GLDLLRLAAVLVNGRDPFLEVHTGFDGSEHFITGPEDTGEEMKLLIEELEHAEVCLVLPVEEVYHHHVMLLPIAVAAADALLDALRIPRQIIIHDEGAELEIDPLRTRLGCDHDAAFLAEIIDERGTHVGAAGAGYLIA